VVPPLLAFRAPLPIHVHPPLTRVCPLPAMRAPLLPMRAPLSSHAHPIPSVLAPFPNRVHPLLPFALSPHLCALPRFASNAGVEIHLTFAYTMSAYSINGD
jgi:hypothetical protein